MEHIETIKKEFAKQSKDFDKYQRDLAKTEYMNQAIAKIGFAESDSVLEVAAGTCAFGRLIAPCVESIIEYDVTKEMLNVGKEEAEKSGITNMTFRVGLAEKLPYENDSFDKVVTRLSFHHFLSVGKPFEEMVRVTKPNGKIAIIDMEARQEEFRKTADDLEKFRDNSHIKCLSKKEFVELAEKKNLKVEICETKQLPVLLDKWIELTKCSEKTSREIKQKMEDDINGKYKTGFEPYMKDGKIYFNHKFLLLIATKP